MVYRCAIAVIGSDAWFVKAQGQSTMASKTLTARSAKSDVYC